MNRLRVVIVGATGQGGYGHQLDRAFSASNRAEVVAVADLAGREYAQRKAAELGAPRSYCDYQSMFAVEAPDIVVVAPRHLHNHEEVVVSAFDHGAHVYCEKPLATSLLEADRMVFAANVNHRKLACALPWRHEPRSQTVHDIVHSKMFGQLRTMTAACKCDHRGGGEDMFILGHHFADMMRWIAGPAQSCWSSVRVEGREFARSDITAGGERIGNVAGTDIEAHFRFNRGVTGHLMSYRANIKDRASHPYRMFLQGTRGIVSVRAPYADNAVWFYPEPVLRPDGPKWERIPTTTTAAYSDYHEPAADDLIQSILDDREPKCSGADARDALEMIHGIYHSALARQSVNFPLAAREHPLE